MSSATKAERDAAFAEFVRQAEPSLMRTAWLLTGSADASRELVQAALVKTYVSWARVEPATALAFARRILVNHKVDTWRKHSREVVRPPLDDDARSARDRPGTTPHPRQSDDRDQIVRLLAQLPEQQRKVVVLRYYVDLSEQATADALGVSLGTVKSTASRALATLRELSAQVDAVVVPATPVSSRRTPTPTPTHPTAHGSHR